MKLTRNGPAWMQWLATCGDCGKRCFETRADAKRSAQQHPGRRMRAYRCGQFWHIGHVPRRVKAGGEW
ncbi:MAG TPA: hypothetical protein VFH77_00450 [Streptomyces sp.]|nr:hypothetical protein [Streptomyces sp.]